MLSTGAYDAFDFSNFIADKSPQPVVRYTISYSTTGLRRYQKLANENLVTPKKLVLFKGLALISRERCAILVFRLHILVGHGRAYILD